MVVGEDGHHCRSGKLNPAKMFSTFLDFDFINHSSMFGGLFYFDPELNETRIPNLEAFEKVTGKIR